MFFSDIGGRPRMITSFVEVISQSYPGLLLTHHPLEIVDNSVPIEFITISEVGITIDKKLMSIRFLEYP